MATRRLLGVITSLCVFAVCGSLMFSRGMFIDLESGEVREQIMVLGGRVHSRQLTGFGPIVNGSSARSDWRQVGPSSPIWVKPRGNGVFGAVRGTYDTFDEILDICALSEDDRRIAWKRLIHCVRLGGNSAVLSIKCDQDLPVMECIVDGESIVLFEIPRDCDLCN